MTNMQSVTISLNTIEKVRNFVSKIALLEGDFDIVSDRYIIDAKSIMGIFSLDLSKPLKLNIHNATSAEKVKEDFKEFIV